MPATIPPILSRRRRDLTKPYQAKGRARNPTFVQYKNLIGTRVFKKLLGMDIQFKCEFARLIHEFGRKTRFQKHQILAAENLYGWIIEGREAKKRFLFPGRRTYHCEPENWVKIRYSLPQGTPVSRLVKLRLKREQSLLDGVKKLFSDELNAARIGEAKIVRAPADAPWDAATASASMQRKFPVPYSNYWKWPQTYANINVTIPANYEQVITANLEVVDGLITLAVQGQPGNPGEKVWKARWARKARGFSFVVEDGFIVELLGIKAHGKSVAKARATLTRRLSVKLDAHEGRILQRLEKYDSAGFETILVTAADSLEAGNCEEGTRAFIDKYFPGRTSATIPEILKACRSFSSRHLAITACLMALRRSKVT